MANLHLVTGYAGVEHITSDDQGSFNAAIMGTGQFILERGRQFEASIISNNRVRVFAGDALMQGRHIRLKENTYVDLNFDNGQQGYSRIDLIVIRYTKDSATDIETANLVVIKGTPSETGPSVPDHVVGDLIEKHDIVNDLVLYKVPFNGLNIQPLEEVFDTVPTWATLKKQVIENVTAKIDKLVEDAVQQIEAAQKPLVSDVEEMLLIENYGEYAADAKTVGEMFNGLNAKTPQIESGFVNVQFSTTVRTYKITFKNPFQEPPVIQLTVYSGQYGAHARAMITGITTIGFEFGTYDNDSSSASGSVYWLAIDKS